MQLCDMVCIKIINYGIKITYRKVKIMNKIIMPLKIIKL